ncbi:MAG: hypothetical protein GY754_17735 [bacterium]|nr:hypothetical protein [bacterium]
MSYMKIGELLVRSGRITKVQLDKALEHQGKEGGLLGKVLVDLGYIQNDNLMKVLSKQRESKITDNLSI